MKAFNTVEDIELERQNQRANDIVYNLLGALIDEIDQLFTGETPTPDQIYSVVNRIYNNAKEMSQYKIASKVEMEYLQEYVKSHLTESELIEILLKYKEEGFKSVGDFMRALSSKYKGRFDEGIASKLINKLLK